jgi:endoglucanase
MHRDTNSKAYWAVGGDGMEKADLRRVFSRPVFRWFGRWNFSRFGGIDQVVASYIRRANREQPGAVPQLAVMRHLGQHCNPRYQAGGPAEDERTRQWYRDFARGVGDARVVIAFEPDSLGTVDCLARSRQRARLDVLRYGIGVLSQLPRATIYIEAGASDWEPAARTAGMLRHVGVGKVRGFMLNVTHYDWTANNIKYGLDISRRIGGKPFVISTSFNGRGPVHYRQRLRGKKKGWRSVNVWCHPLKRGLGIAPTTVTHHPKVDAYLHIGRPGYSAGGCNGGPPTVGAWWEQRAVMLGRYATNWLAPPPRTRYGLYGHPTLRSVAGDQLPD